MMRALCTTLLLAALLTGCANIDYFGKHYPPTASVDVFLDEGEVARPFEKMGYLTVQTGEHADSEVYILEMQRKACAVGGHALILHQPTTESHALRTRSSGDERTRKHKNRSHTRTRANSVTRIIKKKILKADVIRYKEEPLAQPR